jgi:hypothetical protein
MDMNASKIIQAISKVIEKEPQDNMLYGTVESVKPLKIKLNNKIILTEKMLFLGQACRPYKVKIPHTHQINGVTEKSKAISGINQQGEYTKTIINKETGEEETEQVSVDLGGSEINYEGEGTLTKIEPEGHAHIIKEQYTENVHKKDTDYEESVTIEIEPKLQEGDRVLLFAFNNFKMFYVAERLEKEKSE